MGASGRKLQILMLSNVKFNKQPNKLQRDERRSKFAAWGFVIYIEHCALNLIVPLISSVEWEVNQSIWKYKLSKIFLDFPVPQYARRASILRAISYFSVQATQMVSANENLWILSSWRSLVAKTILLRAIININQESKCTSVMRCVSTTYLLYRTSPQCLSTTIIFLSRVFLTINRQQSKQNNLFFVIS